MIQNAKPKVQKMMWEVIKQEVAQRASLGCRYSVIFYFCACDVFPRMQWFTFPVEAHSQTAVNLSWRDDSSLAITNNQLWDTYSSHRRTGAERWETQVPWRGSLIHRPSQRRVKRVWRILRHCKNRIHFKSKHFLFHFCKVFIPL